MTDRIRTHNAPMIHYTISCTPNTCHNTFICPKGRWLPKRVVANSYLFWGFFTSSQMRLYARPILFKAERWMRVANRGTVRSTSDGEESTSRVERKESNLRKALDTSWGEPSERWDNGVYRYIFKIRNMKQRQLAPLTLSCPLSIIFIIGDKPLSGSSRKYYYDVDKH